VANAEPPRRTLNRVVSHVGSRSCACQSRSPTSVEVPNVSTRETADAIGSDEHQSATRHEVHEPSKRQCDRVEIRVDVRVIELDVVDHGDVGQVLQKLRGLVEEGAVVLVPLDDEISPLAEPIARPLVAEVSDDAADQHARIGPAVRQQPAGQRGRRGLAVRAGNHDRARAPEKVLADGFGQRAVADLPVEHFLELRVASRDGIAHHDEIQLRADVFRPVAGERRNPFSGQKIAHRRVHVLVRSANVEPLPLEHRGQRRHRRAADAD
jgi:hypothetical protein